MSEDALHRLRKVLSLVAPAALAAYDAWEASPPWEKDPKGPPLDVWICDYALTWREQWDQLHPAAQQAWVGHAKHGLLRHALEQGATITGFSEVQPHRDQDPFKTVVSLAPMLAIQATGWRVRPEGVPES